MEILSDEDLVTKFRLQSICNEVQNMLELRDSQRVCANCRYLYRKDSCKWWDYEIFDPDEQSCKTGFEVKQ